MSLTHLQRLQAAIIGRVAFHPQLCWNLEQTCNLWMGSWDCWLGFRHDKHEQTELSKYYVEWFSKHFRSNVAITTNISVLYDNLCLLETLPVEIQLEIHNYVATFALPLLLLTSHTSRVSEEMAVRQTGGG